MARLTFLLGKDTVRISASLFRFLDLWLIYAVVVALEPGAQ